MDAPLSYDTQIPNQPIVFAADPGNRRSEDDAVGWTWLQYVKNGDPNQILYFPMTKAVVKAMDAVTEFTQKITGTV